MNFFAVSFLEKFLIWLLELRKAIELKKKIILITGLKVLWIIFIEMCQFPHGNVIKVNINKT